MYQFQYKDMYINIFNCLNEDMSYIYFNKKRPNEKWIDFSLFI